MPRRTHFAPDILQVAKEKLHFPSLRPGQEEAIRSVLDRHDTLVVQPTGSGKSAIYQIAAHFLEGTALVISPLIALQKDQVDAINQEQEAEAAVVNSTQCVAESREAFEKLAEGKLNFLFLAPEQLHKPETVDKLKEAGVSLLVVDEAHCISEWGHDFRPDYLRLGAVIEDFGHPVVLALTATASPIVREEIVERLGMRKPNVLVRGFDRPNIFLRVDHYADEDEKLEALLHHVRWAEKPGIIYTSTRKSAEEIMRGLREEGTDALFYHGGLKAKDREAIQERFMAGKAEVMVATNAFGMGVDKANIRFVFHHDISDSLDSYYQEIGRAGRDGEPAEAVLFYRSEDLGIHKFHAGGTKLEAEKIGQVVEAIAHEDGPINPEEIVEETHLSERKVVTALHRLEDVGAVESLPSGEVQLTEDVKVSEAAQAAAREQERFRKEQRLRLEAIQAYAELSTCRRETLLRYFADPFAGPCGHCDNCQGKKKGLKLDLSAGTRREVTAEPEPAR